MPFNVVMFCLRFKFLSPENSLHLVDSAVFFGQFLGIDLSTHYDLQIKNSRALAIGSQKRQSSCKNDQQNLQQK